MIFYIVFTCTFFFAEKALGYYGLEYRTVTVVAGKSIVWMIPWIAGIFLIRLWNRKSAEKKGTTGWSALPLFCLILYLILMIFASGIAGVMGLLRLRTEEKKDDVLLVTIPHFLQESEIYYCDPVGPFLRRPFQRDAEREKALLRQKYGMDFMLVEEDRHVRRYAPFKYPDVRVRISEPVPLQDDFGKKLADYYFQSAYDTEQMQTFREIEDISSNYADGEFLLVISERSDIAQGARDAADLIAAAYKDPFFRKYEGWLTCVLRLDGQEHTETFYFGAHKPFDEDGTPYDYYADYENVFPILENAWMELEEEIRQQILDSAWDTDPDQEKDWDEIQKREEEQQMREYQELEESARILYETLAGSGEGFEASYNAKGNLYVLLPSGETQRSITYDRISENGLCNLFALYEYTIDKNGNRTSEPQMVDYYAVNITTGEVTASGKHMYSDSGTEAYHNATGEW